jgi:hypothetical protein
VGACPDLDGAVISLMNRLMARADSEALLDLEEPVVAPITKSTVIGVPSGQAVKLLRTL